ncbi:hypothetical protein [Marispirochaeta aestuarii]|nr:hypothetical protein [Marispirochaeta aestuarii]
MGNRDGLEKNRAEGAEAVEGECGITVVSCNGQENYHAEAAGEEY